MTLKFSNKIRIYIPVYINNKLFHNIGLMHKFVKSSYTNEFTGADKAIL